MVYFIRVHPTCFRIIVPSSSSHVLVARASGTSKCVGCQPYGSGHICGFLATCTSCMPLGEYDSLMCHRFGGCNIRGVVVECEVGLTPIITFAPCACPQYLRARDTSPPILNGVNFYLLRDTQRQACVATTRIVGSRPGRVSAHCHGTLYSPK
ncbi:hypothetical protein BD413DRAFT_73022 [Trametes elegans]|nr:hypothetical protein BD413DRAFT_73022 [Trametes elegans]